MENGALEDARGRGCGRRSSRHRCRNLDRAVRTRRGPGRPLAAARGSSRRAGRSRDREMGDHGNHLHKYS